jgi:hypothetical protein
MVADWASTNHHAFSLHLSGPAGGTYTSGNDGPHLDIDASEWAWTISGRAPGSGLLANPLPAEQRPPTATQPAACPTSALPPGPASLPTRPAALGSRPSPITMHRSDGQACRSRCSARAHHRGRRRSPPSSLKAATWTGMTRRPGSRPWPGCWARWSGWRPPSSARPAMRRRPLRWRPPAGSVIRPWTAPAQRPRCAAG